MFYARTSVLVVELHRLLDAAYGAGHFVRDHSPVAGTRESIPEPDIAVVRGAPRDFLASHPGPAHVVLLVEIAYSSTSLDRRKANVYAQAGYAQYWLVDVGARRVEVRTAPKNGIYTHTDIVDEGGTLTLPHVGTTVAAHALLP